MIWFGREAKDRNLGIHRHFHGLAHFPSGIAGGQRVGGGFGRTDSHASASGVDGADSGDLHLGRVQDIPDQSGFLADADLKRLGHEALNRDPGISRADHYAIGTDSVVIVLHSQAEVIGLPLFGREAGLSRGRGGEGHRGSADLLPDKGNGIVVRVIGSRTIEHDGVGLDTDLVRTRVGHRHIVSRPDGARKRLIADLGDADRHGSLGPGVVLRIQPLAELEADRETSPVASGDESLVQSAGESDGDMVADRVNIANASTGGVAVEPAELGCEIALEPGIPPCAYRCRDAQLIHNAQVGLFDSVLAQEAAVQEGAVQEPLGPEQAHPPLGKEVVEGAGRLSESPAVVEFRKLYVFEAREDSRLHRSEPVDDPQIELALVPAEAVQEVALRLDGMTSSERQEHLALGAHGQVAVWRDGTRRQVVARVLVGGLRGLLADHLAHASLGEGLRRGGRLGLQDPVGLLELVNVVFKGLVFIHEFPVLALELLQRRQDLIELLHLLENLNATSLLRVQMFADR